MIAAIYFFFMAFFLVLGITLVRTGAVAIDGQGQLGNADKYEPGAIVRQLAMINRSTGIFLCLLPFMCLAFKFSLMTFSGLGMVAICVNIIWRWLVSRSSYVAFESGIFRTISICVMSGIGVIGVFAASIYLRLLTIPLFLNFIKWPGILIVECMLIFYPPSNVVIYGSKNNSFYSPNASYDFAALFLGFVFWWLVVVIVWQCKENANRLRLG